MKTGAIYAARNRLSAWLKRQPDYVREIGSQVIAGLDAIQIYPHPMIAQQLFEDVARLEKAVRSRK